MDMKKLILLGVALFCGMCGKVTAQGIVFQERSFQTSQEIAKKENKIIFVDFFTRWCGPCKVLANTVFVLPEVGEYFNKNFVCCKLDAEKEGVVLAKKYKVGAYPTLLFLNSKGEIVNKIIGAVSAEQLLNTAKKTLVELNAPDNLINLKKRYVSEKRDEAFLKNYIDKMIIYRECPYEAIEEYLKIQTTMKENSSKMMEFLIKHGNRLVLGGEAERILNENNELFMAIATRTEERDLENIRRKMLRLTQAMALEEKSPTLYKLFLDRWLRQSSKPRFEDYTELYLELLMLEGKIKAYRKMAVAYLDSLVDSRSIAEIRLSDQKHYDNFCKEHAGYGGLIFEIQKKANKNLDAGIQTRHIIQIGSKLVKYAKRKEFCHFDKWLEHGRKLLPEEHQMEILEAEILLQKGKQDEAVDLLRKTIKLVPEKSRNHLELEDRLAEIEKN